MKRKRNSLLLVVVPVLILTGTVCVFYLKVWTSSSVYELDDAAINGNYQLQPEWSEQSFDLRKPIRVFVNGEPEADKTGRCNLMAGNPQENDSNLYVKVRLDESGEELYSSGVLKPGERDAYVMLNPVPEPGKYHATVEFMVLDRTSGEITGTIEAGITITIVN